MSLNSSLRPIKDLLSLHRSGLTRKLMCDPSLPAELIEGLWDDPDGRLVSRAICLQQKERCAVLRVDLPPRDGTPQSFLLKRHIWGPASRSARMLFRKPTAVGCASMAAILSENDIPTPSVRGCVVDGLGPLSHRSFFLTDFVESKTLFHAIRFNHLPAEQFEYVARQVADIWQKLISLQISHNDLKPENFLLDESNRVWLIDFEKTKLHRQQMHLRRRHLADAERFLHIRCWRQNTAAAEVFRHELLKTSLRVWAEGRNQSTHPLSDSGYSDDELLSKISAVVPVCQSQVDLPALAKTIDSLRDVADEVLLVEPDASSVRLHVWHSLSSRCLTDGMPSNLDQLTTTAETRKPTHPWVLVVRPGELATPDLVRHLPEWILASHNSDALNLPIEQQLPVRTFRWRRPSLARSLRVFRQGHCKFALVAGQPTVVAAEGRAVSKNFGLLAAVAGESSSNSNKRRPRSISDAA